MPADEHKIAMAWELTAVNNATIGVITLVGAVILHGVSNYEYEHPHARGYQSLAAVGGLILWYSAIFPALYNGGIIPFFKDLLSSFAITALVVVGSIKVGDIVVGFVAGFIKETVESVRTPSPTGDETKYGTDD